MENKSRSLSQYLTGFIESLDTPVGHDNDSAAAEMSSPHLESIDFDQLIEKLREAAVELDTADRQNREREIIRRWFIGRITSLQRGYKAIMNETRSLPQAASLDDASLPELMRRYEEESARLRSTAVNYHRKTSLGAERKTPDFGEFKS